MIENQGTLSYIYNWNRSKYLLIDVALVNPLESSRIDLLTKDGVGSAARTHEETKRRTYRDIDFDKYEFLPFVIETCGGMGSAESKLCAILVKLRRESKCKTQTEIENRGKIPWKEQDPLVIAIGIEVERYNSQMILEREPIPVDLIQSELIKCQISVAKQRELAVEELQKEIVRRCRPSDKHTVEVSCDGSIVSNMSDWEKSNQSPVERRVAIITKETSLTASTPGSPAPHNFKALHGEKSSSLQP